MPERRGCAGAPGISRSAGDVPERRDVPGMCRSARSAPCSLGFCLLFELNCACGLVQHWPLHASNMFPKYELVWQSHENSKMFGIIHMKILRFASSPTCCPCSDRFYPNLQRKEQKPRLQK